MRKNFTTFSKLVGIGKSISHYAGMLALSVIMAGCPMAEPEALRPLATTKTDKYANKTAVKPVTSTCRITKDNDPRQYIYNASGQLVECKRSGETTTFIYDQNGYLVSQQGQYTGSASKTILKYFYENGTLSKVEKYSQANEQSNPVLNVTVTLESGKMKKFLSSFNGIDTDVAFKVDGRGRVTEISTGGIVSGVKVLEYFEYDANGNVTKVYDNSPSSYGSREFRYDNKPNPMYEALRFKGHPDTRIVDYIGSGVGYPSTRDYQQPNNQNYGEYTFWNFQTNMPYKTTSSRTFIYNSAGYPTKFTYPNNTFQYTYAEYDNCN